MLLTNSVLESMNFIHVQTNNLENEFSINSEKREENSFFYASEQYFQKNPYSYRKRMVKNLWMRKKKRM